jgi:hypothetical protein
MLWTRTRVRDGAGKKQSWVGIMISTYGQGSRTAEQQQLYRSTAPRKHSRPHAESSGESGDGDSDG